MSKKKNTRFKRGADYYDYSLVAVIILLTCFGLVMLYSTSYYEANMEFEDDMHYFARQAAFSTGSILVALIISKVDYHILQFFVKPLYIISAVLMLMVLSPLGVEVNGAKRWLKLGIQFQPSEIAKIAVIVALSYLVVKMGRKVVSWAAFGILLAVGAFQALIAFLATDNLSTGIIIGGITVGLIFLVFPKTKEMLIMGAVVVVILAIAIIVINATIESSEDFRIRRILVWLKPENYADTYGYQTLQALYAIGSGGFFGKGLGNSVQKLGVIPEAQNDMIFSIICEELGVFGGLIVLLLFAYLLYRLFFIARNAPDSFGALLVSGIFIHVALQVILNICVVINLIPNTGVTLPFVSYGGTSTAFLMGEMGLALGVSRQIRFQEPSESV